MKLITSIYDEMEQDKKILMASNSEHLENMLDFAIDELIEIALENEIYLVDDMNICTTYEEIFNCLKHRSEKRIQRNK